MKISFLSRMALAVAAAFTVTSCIDDDNSYTPPTEAGFAIIANISPGSGNLSFFNDSNPLNDTPLGYGKFSPYYYSLPIGTRTLSVRSSNGTQLDDTQITIKNGDIVSAFAVKEGESTGLFVYRDTLKQPASGNARVRIVNLSPDAPAISVSTPTATLATGLDFKETTKYMEITTGTYNLTFKDTETGETLFTKNATPFSAGNIYILYVKGYVTPPAGSTDTLSADNLAIY